MASSVDRNRMFFQLQQYSRNHSSFSAHKAALRTKTELIFPAFSLTLVDFAVQFCFRCKFSFHEKQVIEKDFEIKSWSCVCFFYCIKQIDSMLPCVCSVNRSLSPCVPLFCSYHILTSSVIYYWTDARQHGIYLLNRNMILNQSAGVFFRAIF